MRPHEVLAGAGSFLMDTHGLQPGHQVSFSIRPEDVVVGGTGIYEGVVLDVAYLGSTFTTVVEIGGLRFESMSRQLNTVAIGSSCRVDLPYEAITVWTTDRESLPGQDLASDTDIHTVTVN
jgi:ABC-type Fe3+/spermidine/putrescine transport system ATPase subunit